MDGKVHMVERVVTWKGCMDEGGEGMKLPPRRSGSCLWIAGESSFNSATTDTLIS